MKAARLLAPQTGRRFPYEITLTLTFAGVRGGVGG